MPTFPLVHAGTSARPAHTVPPVDDPLPPGIPPDLPLPPEEDPVPPPVDPPVGVPPRR
ncbi:hypothetical protein [Cupriavidus yeoncheonensis]|nr:hypothetical protein [Cupriavidus yeoncheonensis]